MGGRLTGLGEWRSMGGGRGVADWRGVGSGGGVGGGGEGDQRVEELVGCDAVGRDTALVGGLLSRGLERRVNRLACVALGICH